MSTGKNLNHARMRPDRRLTRFLKVYKVEADRLTGEWRAPPVNAGEMVSAFVWSRQEDTPEKHFTMFQPEPEKDETHALVVAWQ
jgi:hypothetical protein